MKGKKEFLRAAAAMCSRAKPSVEPRRDIEPLREEDLSAVSGGRAAMTEFVVVKRLDKASTTLAKACASGKHLDTGVIVS